MMMTQRSSYEMIHKLNTLQAAGSALLALSLMACAPAIAAADEHRADHYRQLNLVSDLSGVALLQDASLVNAWGISSSPVSPFWVSANGTGKSPLYAVTYDGQGMVQVAKVPLEVSIPGEGSVTGQVFDGTGEFGHDIFVFAGEDGTISGWRSTLGPSAEVLATRPSAVYKGITQAMTAMGPALLAANFTEGTVDVYDTSLALVAQLTDPHAPPGYAPFNVQNLGGMVFVTFAKRREGGGDDVAGPGHGFIDRLDPRTGMLHRLATGTDAGGRVRAINSPWGLAIAPRTFGKHAGQLLVGNFGSGTIMAFDLRTGQFRGLLEAENNGPVVIEGLWGLSFGNGGRAGRQSTLYFSAGPGGESHGLFGSLDPVREDHDEDGD
jgi:uncharacterized protein (TIGR03118 family)